MRVRPDPSASRVALELNETFMKEAISIFVFSSAGQLGYALDFYIVNPGKLEHGFWGMNAGIPYTLP